VIRYGSVCSGIEAATVAWHPLGWAPAWFAEIDPFPCAVLAHHYPAVPNLGDMTKITGDDLDRAGAIDLLVGGTPCQSFSVAGLRKGLADPRGNLALEFLRLLDRTRARWVVWENVPGVLSSAGGRDFGAFLGALGELGYGWSYRVLDAQYFGVAQRRRRVFVVGHLGDWRRACAVLLERSSLRGDPAPSREAGAGTSPEFAPCLRGRSNSSHRPDTEAYVAHAVTCHQVKGGDPTTDNYVASGFYETGKGWWNEGLAGLRAEPGGMPENVVAYQCHGSNVGPMGTVRAGNGNETGGVPFTRVATGVRRLTPVECARLQGFPDTYLDIPYRGKPACDGPKYKALGNSMAVPVMRWIGERIAAVESIL